MQPMACTSLMGITASRYLDMGAGAGVGVMIVINAVVINGATAGNVQLQWAQNTAEVSNTKVLANSCICAVKLV